MLKKLFYYEIKLTSRLLILLHGIALILALAVFGLLSIPGMENSNFVTAFIQGLAVLLLASTAFFTYFFLAFRYYKTVYTNEGYLTHTLPVTSGQILMSRFLTAVIWMGINVVILLICLSLVGKVNLFNEFATHFPALAEEMDFALLMLGLFIVGFLMTILSIFCSVSIGNLFSGHKVMGSIICFFFLNLVVSILSLLPLLFFVKGFMQLPPGKYTIAQFQAWYPDIFQSLKTALGLEAVLYVLISIGLYWLTWYLLDKKLNLE